VAQVGRKTPSAASATLHIPKKPPFAAILAGDRPSRSDRGSPKVGNAHCAEEALFYCRRRCVSTFRVCPFGGALGLLASLGATWRHAHREPPPSRRSSHQTRCRTFATTTVPSAPTHARSKGCRRTAFVLW
jgi:hypothetical protein